jgi:streptogrisin C
MKTTRFLGAAAAAVLAAGVLTGFAVPASAGQDLLNPDMVPAMQRDLGLTHDQAMARLQSEDGAAKLAQAVAATLGDTLAGVTYNAATGKAHIETTNPAQLAKIRQSGAEAELVKFSARQLDSTVDVLNAGEKAAPAAVIGWGVDSVTNRVTLNVLRGQRSTAEAFLTKSGVDTSAVTLAETTGRPSLHYNISGGDAYYIGGSARCSAGFATTTGLLSAGHCAALTGAGALTGSNGVSLGSWGAYSFPTNDYSAIRTNSNWTPLGQMNNGTAVRGSTAAATGASVCKAGSTTGWTCGTVGAKNQTVRYSEGTVFGMTATSAHSAAGDSGGGFISGNQAQGLLSGGDGTTTYFFPVNTALSATGTTLKLG